MGKKLKHKRREIVARLRIQAAFDSGLPELIQRIAEKAHPADVAAYLYELDPDARDQRLQNVPAAVLVRLAEFLPMEDTLRSLGHLEAEARTSVLDQLPDDYLVDLLQALPQDERDAWVQALPPAKRTLSNSLLQYPESTAGGRMTTAFAKLKADMTIRDAIEHLNSLKERTEILSRIFVVDEAGRILGKVRLRDLTFNSRRNLISEVMDSDTLSIEAHADQEEAAQMITKYDLLALPVVNEDLRLLGVITYDDAMDILEEEITEDMELISGIGGERGDQSYLNTPVLRHFRRRFLWVLVLAFTGLFSGSVLLHSEDVIKDFYILSLYLPMVVAAGGNTGSQAATMVIRAMSTDEMSPGSFLRVVWKELRIGLLMGSLLGLCVALQIRFLLPASANPEAISVLTVAKVVGVALTMQVSSSTMTGAILPLAAKAARLDPAVVASPAITTLVDVTGMLIYFNLARLLMAV